MELNQDWRGYQQKFFPVRKGSAEERRPIYVVADKGMVLTIFVEGEDLSQWQGSSVEEMRSQFTHRSIVEADRSEMDQWLIRAMGGSHLPGQIAQLREQWLAGAKGDDKEGARSLLPGRVHFLLEAIQSSWWARVLPSSFGVLLRFEDESASDGAPSFNDFLLVYRKGALEQFGEPDLSFLGSDRRTDLSDVIGYLGERFSLPVQSVLMRSQDWEKWSSTAHPWKEIAWAIQSKRVQLVPHRWQWVGLVATRGFIGI